MAKVCVIIGGKIGFATAKCMPREKIILLAGTNTSDLEKHAKELKNLGYTVYTKACDVMQRHSVQELVAFASGLGEVQSVVNCLSVAPTGKVETIICGNALATVYINQEFSMVMGARSAIVNMACASIYALPRLWSWKMSFRTKKLFALADLDEGEFFRCMVKRCGKAKEGERRLKFAYMFSKKFVAWYAKKCAFIYAEKGIRVVSVSPTFSREDATREQLGYTLATLADERNVSVNGVDVLCDGGADNQKTFEKQEKK